VNGEGPRRGSPEADCGCCRQGACRRAARCGNRVAASFQPFLQAMELCTLARAVEALEGDERPCGMDRVYTAAFLGAVPRRNLYLHWEDETLLTGDYENKGGHSCGCDRAGFRHPALAQAAAPIELMVDMRDAPRKILHAELTMPVRPGPLTLVYPKWIPESTGHGPIADMAGLVIETVGRAAARCSPDPG